MSIYVEGTGDTTLVFMSGLEAIYWAQKYPNEVSAIIGLDMAVPEYYDSMNINIPIMHIAGWAANIGVTRFIPGISDSDAIKYHWHSYWNDKLKFARRHRHGISLL